MNKAILMGRLTKDVDLRQTQNNIPVASFTLAVDRPGKIKATDFINCVAWRQTAEFVSKYFGKGRLILVVGSIQTRQYTDKNGQNRTVTEVLVDEVSFTGEPKQAAPAVQYEDEPDDELPF